MKGKDMKCRTEGCENEAWPAWNDICRECLAEMDYMPSDSGDEPVNEDEDYEEREESHGK